MALIPPVPVAVYDTPTVVGAQAAPAIDLAVPATPEASAVTPPPVEIVPVPE